MFLWPKIVTFQTSAQEKFHGQMTYVQDHKSFSKHQNSRVREDFIKIFEKNGMKHALPIDQIGSLGNWRKSFYHSFLFSPP